MSGQNCYISIEILKSLGRIWGIYIYIYMEINIGNIYIYIILYMEINIGINIVINIGINMGINIGINIVILRVVHRNADFTGRGRGWKPPARTSFRS